MSPHYDRHIDLTGNAESSEASPGGPLDDAAAENAAGALREVEIEAAQEDSDVPNVDSSRLEQMTIDELRVLARKLDIPDRGTIIEQDELIEEIRKRL
jgi:hypothetical protein